MEVPTDAVDRRGVALASRELELAPLVRGDLDRVIRWVHSSEMPDPSAYLRGGEVVLSAGIWFWAGSSPQVFAAGLAGAGAAAIGFGPSPLVPAVPPALVEACAEHGLTLFAIPDHVPFIAVIETFVERYVEDRERELLDAQDRNEQLVRAAQERQGIRACCACSPATARARPGSSSAGAGCSPRPAASRPPSSSPRSPASGRHPLPGWTVVPIVPTGIDAWLVVEGGLELPHRASAIEQAVAFLAIELQRDLAVRESERRFAAELVDLVAAGDAQLAGRHGEAARPSGSIRRLPSRRSSARRTTPRTGSPRSSRCSRMLGVTQRGRGQGPADRGDGRLAARRPPSCGTSPARSAPRSATGSAVGVGGVASGVRELRRALIEAQQACQFAARGAPGFAMYAEVGSHAALLALQDESVVAQFRDALLRPLVEHDRRRHTELVRTLELFLESGGAYQQTADELHVHVNTLRLRLARVEELTGRSLSDMETRVDLFIALRARR